MSSRNGSKDLSERVFTLPPSASPVGRGALVLRIPVPILSRRNATFANAPIHFFHLSRPRVTSRRNSVGHRHSGSRTRAFHPPDSATKGWSGSRDGGSVLSARQREGHRALRARRLRRDHRGWVRGHCERRGVRLRIIHAKRQPPERNAPTGGEAFPEVRSAPPFHLQEKPGGDARPGDRVLHSIAVAAERRRPAIRLPRRVSSAMGAHCCGYSPSPA
jgi:hypothetical protein